MSRSKKARTPPTCFYYDNPYSSFGMIYTDLLKSRPFQELSPTARNLYIICVAHAQTEESKTCLYNRLTEINKSLCKGMSDEEIKKDVWTGEKFVFPKCQYTKYGFSSPNFSKYMLQLQESGFIKTVYGGRNQYAANVFQFSDKWKAKA